MTIGKRKAGGIVMVRAAIIHRIRAGCNNRASSIVDRPRIIIQKDPDVGRGNSSKVTELAECRVRIIGSMRVTSIEPRTIDLVVAVPSTFRSDTLLHGNTS